MVFMKKMLFFITSILLLVACDKTYVCNCGYASGGLPYKKVYLKAKTDKGAERRCKKQELSGESCVLQ